MEKFETQVAQMESQLKEWAAGIDASIAKAEKAGAEAKQDYRKEVDALRGKLAAARTKLDDVKTEGSEKWETFKTGIEIAWVDLELAFKSLAS